MKLLLKAFALLGGLGAVGWLMRNRFVGLTLNREPETPEPSPEPVAESRPASDLLQIQGMTTAQADLLHTLGIAGAARLAEEDAADLAARAGLEESTVAGWIKQAAALVQEVG